MQHAAEELENAAALCGEISRLENEDELTAGLLEDISSFLGADVGAFRVFCVAKHRARLATLQAVGVPERVNDAYLTRFCKLDPARRIFRQRFSATLFADEMPPGGGWLPARASGTTPVFSAGFVQRYREDFLRYRKDFLLPNRLYHHLGFCFQDPSSRRTFLFDFHRVNESAAPFGRAESARARILAALLHAKFAGIHAFDEARDDEAAEYSRGFSEQLSARELEVAEAVAQGLSNKEVAARMQISVRTVENHMRSIFAKLGVTTRTRLAAKLHEARSERRLAVTATV